MYMFIINTTYWHTDIYEYVNIQMCTSTFPFFCFQFLNLLVLQVQIGGEPPYFPFSNYKKCSLKEKKEDTTLEEKIISKAIGLNK